MTSRWPIAAIPAVLDVVHDRELKGKETVRVYLGLALWCDDTRYTYLKVSALASRLGVARSTARAAIDELKARGYVEEREMSRKSRAFRLPSQRIRPE